MNAGKPLTDITRGIVEALDPDLQIEAARKATGKADPDEQEIKAAADKLLAEAAKPIATNPVLRQKIVDIKKVLRADDRHDHQGRTALGGSG